MLRAAKLSARRRRAETLDVVSRLVRRGNAVMTTAENAAAAAMTVSKAASIENHQR